MVSNAIKYEARRIGVEEAALIAFTKVESGGQGFDNITGKLIIQFEPRHFAKRTNVLINNRVDVQAKEWRAFNEAFRINPTAAMESTSIGLGQIMGFHWERLGYNSVGDMWDDAKRGLHRQVYQMAQFIYTDKRLLNALRNKNWHLVATYYNGAGYKRLARQLGREPYNISLRKAYERARSRY